MSRPRPVRALVAVLLRRTGLDLIDAYLEQMCATFPTRPAGGAQ